LTICPERNAEAIALLRFQTRKRAPHPTAS
jgi:hypothetical protein